MSECDYHKDGACDCCRGCLTLRAALAEREALLRECRGADMTAKGPFTVALLARIDAALRPERAPAPKGPVQAVADLLATREALASVRLDREEEGTQTVEENEKVPVSGLPATGGLLVDSGANRDSAPAGQQESRGRVAPIPETPATGTTPAPPKPPEECESCGGAWIWVVGDGYDPTACPYEFHYPALKPKPPESFEVWHRRECPGVVVYPAEGRWCPESAGGSDDMKDPGIPWAPNGSCAIPTAPPKVLRFRGRTCREVYASEHPPAGGEPSPAPEVERADRIATAIAQAVLSASIDGLLGHERLGHLRMLARDYHAALDRAAKAQQERREGRSA